MYGLCGIGLFAPEEMSIFFKKIVIVAARGDAHNIIGGKTLYFNRIRISFSLVPLIPFKVVN